MNVFLSRLVYQVPSKLQQSFSFWNMGRSKLESCPLPSIDRSSNMKTVCSVSFRPVTSQNGRLKTVGKSHGKVKEISSLRGKFLEVHSQTGSHSWASSNSISNLQRQRSSSDRWLHAAPERDLDSILSLHSSLYNFEERRETVWWSYSVPFFPNKRALLEIQVLKAFLYFLPFLYQEEAHVGFLGGKRH